MANNQYVNKVEYAGQTLMDLTGDTVTPSDVLNGVMFHDRSGASQQGNMITHNVYDGLDSSSTDDALSANQGKVLNTTITSLLSWNAATGATRQAILANLDALISTNGVRFGYITTNNASTLGLSISHFFIMLANSENYRCLFLISSDGDSIKVLNKKNGTWSSSFKSVSLV